MLVVLLQQSDRFIAFTGSSLETLASDCTIVLIHLTLGTPHRPIFIHRKVSSVNISYSNQDEA